MRRLRCSSAPADEAGAVGCAVGSSGVDPTVVAGSSRGATGEGAGSLAAVCAATTLRAAEPPVLHVPGATDRAVTPASLVGHGRMDVRVETGDGDAAVYHGLPLLEVSKRIGKRCAARMPRDKPRTAHCQHETKEEAKNEIRVSELFDTLLN